MLSEDNPGVKMKLKFLAPLLFMTCSASVAFSAQHEVEIRLDGTPELLTHVPVVQFLVGYPDGTSAAASFSAEEINAQSKHFFIQDDQGQPNSCSFGIIIDFKPEWLVPSGFAGPINGNFQCPALDSKSVTISSGYEITDLKITVPPSAFETRKARALAWNISAVDSSGAAGLKKGGAVVGSSISRAFELKVLHRDPLHFRLSLKWILKDGSSKSESLDAKASEITIP